MSGENIEQKILDLSDIRRDGGTQMRESISQVSVVTYAEHMQDGTQFPPITVFYDGADYWLADGFHRCAAYDLAGITEVPADVRSGMRIDAIRFAMGTNDKNGRPRSGDDMRRIYCVGIENEVFEADDAQAVQDAAKCSMRWANRLTQEARDKAKVVRNEQIIELSGEGKTQREIAGAVGVDHKTVGNVLSGENGNSSQIPQTHFEPHTENHEEPVDDMEKAEESEEAGKEAKRNMEVAEAVESVEKIKEVMKNHLAIGTGQNEWYTPAEYIDMAREVMGGIDLDPASCEEANKTVMADMYYTKEDSGLDHDWAGKLFMNPPYSRDLMSAFVEKLCQSYKDGTVSHAILVSHNNTDTQWFHQLAEVASVICFPKKRIRFYRNENVAAPTNGQVFFYLGKSTSKFSEVFGAIGLVVTPV